MTYYHGWAPTISHPNTFIQRLARCALKIPKPTGDTHFLPEPFSRGQSRDRLPLVMSFYSKWEWVLKTLFPRQSWPKKGKSDDVGFALRKMLPDWVVFWRAWLSQLMSTGLKTGPIYNFSCWPGMCLFTPWNVGKIIYSKSKVWGWCPLSDQSWKTKQNLWEDQRFLSDQLWPTLKSSFLIHVLQ